MTAEQYRLACAAAWINTMRKRDHAIETAREFYDLGHAENAVRLLVLEARLHNHHMLRLRRGAQ